MTISFFRNLHFIRSTVEPHLTDTLNSGHPQTVLFTNLQFIWSTVEPRLTDTLNSGHPQTVLFTNLQFIRSTVEPRLTDTLNSGHPQLKSSCMSPEVGSPQMRQSVSRLSFPNFIRGFSSRKYVPHS